MPKIALSQLVETQRRELNALLPPWTEDQLGMALIDEIGELTHLLKWGVKDEQGYDGEAGWAWWPRENKPVVSRAQVLEGLADILHFLLSFYILAFKEDPPVSSLEKEWERCWDEKGIWESATLIYWIIDGAMRWGAQSFFVSFVELCRSLKFSREDIERSYLVKAQVNWDRWRGNEN